MLDHLLTHVLLHVHEFLALIDQRFDDVRHGLYLHGAFRVLHLLKLGVKPRAHLLFLRLHLVHVVRHHPALFVSLVFVGLFLGLCIDGAEMKAHHDAHQKRRYDRSETYGTVSSHFSSS